MTAIAIASAIVAGVLGSQGFEADLSSIEDDTTGAMGAAFMDGARYTYLALAAVGLAALIAALRMKPARSERAAPPAAPS